MPVNHSQHDQSADFKICQVDKQRQRIDLIGYWVIGNDLPNLDRIIDKLDNSRIIQFNADTLFRWDSRLLTRLTKLIEYCQRNNITVEFEGLPTGVRRLLQLALAVPERKQMERSNGGEFWLSTLGNSCIRISADCKSALEFIGELTMVMIKFLLGKARYRRKDLISMLAHCGPKALPIVTLIGILVGLILAFVGAVQLRMFGAQIYIANLVGLGMTREMGAMMTAVIMAGRTGAAFAAQLGSMQANEEIDALKTMGISAMEFLVLPRLLALIVMLPLLSLYANFMGIAGGFIVGVGLLDITISEYYHQTVAAMGLNDFSVGLIKSVVFGVLVAISGCIRGMHCGNSAAAVGNASTSAVVTSIVAIVVTDAIMTVLYDAIGI